MIDYTKSAEDFHKNVAADATSFRPPGEKIGSYARHGDVGKGKGKAVNGSAAHEDDEGAIVFEMYKVSLAVFSLELLTHR